MRTSARWGIPVTVAAAVVGGSFLVPAAASAVPELAPTTAQGLLTDLASAKPVPFSGTVVQKTDLGLPDLSAVTGGSSDDPTALTSLVSGTTTARVWSDGASKQRTAVLGKLSETDVVRSGTDVWTWRSGAGTVSHATLPSRSASATPQAAGTPQLAPADAARQALAAVDPTTSVTLGGTTTVAGRAARQLVLTPKDAGSLVGRVVLAVDADTSQPLRVQVFARGATAPAVSTGFSAVSFSAPAAAEVSPALPKGAAVREATPQGGTAAAKAQAQARAAQAGAPHARPTTVGTGWTTVLELPAGAASAAPATPGSDGAGAGGSTAALLQQASQPVSGAFGSGRLITSSLLSALVLDDGRVLVGAVSGSALEAAATAAR